MRSSHGPRSEQGDSRDIVSFATSAFQTPIRFSGRDGSATLGLNARNPSRCWAAIQVVVGIRLRRGIDSDGRRVDARLMNELLMGYARVSTEQQDLTAQREALRGLGVGDDRIYVDHGLTGTNRDRPGLRLALAACRSGDTPGRHQA